jgi:UDP-3-O-[3-hydroxymyristoyl] glucosamine N-acyltransferase
LPTVESLFQHLSDSGYSFQGQELRKNFELIKSLPSLYYGKSNLVSFCSYEESKGMLSISQSNTGVILCKKSVGGRVYQIQKEGQLWMLVDNPRLEFTRLAKRIACALPKVGISKSSVIADSAKIGRDCYIGDYVVIGDNCTIGNNTIIESKANLQNCIVGDNCSIQPNTTIGSDGFAFERTDDTLELEKFPHYGKVVIENDVEIFANCSITRGSLSDTIIG